MAISIDPNTTVWLCKVPLENDYKNQFRFTSWENQIAYFRTTVFASFNNSTYVRKNGYIDVPFSRDYIRTCNYLYYTNPGGFNSTDGQGEPQTVFCFITNIEYLSENSSRVYIETDVYQTWQFWIQYNRCFIEREHVNDDSIGANTIPENLETGEYICNDAPVKKNLGDYGFCIASMVGLTIDGSGNIQVSVDSQGLPTEQTGNIYNGIYSACDYYVTLTEGKMSEVIEKITQKGKLDSIVGVFMFPLNLIDIRQLGRTGVYVALKGDTPFTQTDGVNQLPTIDGVTIKNNKLKCYPYSYLMVTNGGGQSNIYNWEKCATKGQFGYKLDGVITPGCSIRMTPINYNGAVGENFSEGMNLGKFAVCSFPADMYTNWLTQNSIEVFGHEIRRDELDVARGGIKTAGGVTQMLLNTMSENAQGAMMGGETAALGVTDVVDSLISMRQHNLTPMQIRGNTNSGDVITAKKDLTFIFYRMSIRAEYARILDNYFSMYGYKVNRVGIPNITGRRNWNYVKTIGCNFDGDIPNEDLAIIRAMFDRGVTIWHNPQNIYRYDLDNSII